MGGTTEKGTTEGGRWCHPATNASSFLSPSTTPSCCEATRGGSWGQGASGESDITSMVEKLEQQKLYLTQKKPLGTSNQGWAPPSSRSISTGFFSSSTFSSPPLASSPWSQPASFTFSGSTGGRNNGGSLLSSSSPSNFSSSFAKTTSNRTSSSSLWSSYSNYENDQMVQMD